jgi:protein O-mannosyl-transferase
MKRFSEIIIISILCLLVYANTFSNEFVWDDEIFIVENYEIRSLKNIPNFFVEDTFGIYRPVRTIWYALVFNVWELNTFGYHLNSLIFFTSITILFYLITEKLAAKRIAFFSALLFAVHPIHTERVTFMTAGFDLLGILLMLLTFYFYIRFRLERKPQFFFVSLPIYLIALFASEEALTLPIIIMLYDLLYNKIQIKRVLPYFSLAAFYVFIRFFVIDIVSRNSLYFGNSLYFTLLTMTKVVVKYILYLIFPINLTLFPHVPISNTIFDFKVILSMMFITTLGLLAIYFYRKVNLITFAISLIFIALLPFSNILPLQYIMAERYLFIASIGFCFIGAYLISKLVDYQKTIGYTILILIVSIFSVQTVNRNLDWQNDHKLWNKTVISSPHSVTAKINLAQVYLDRGNSDESFALLSESIELDPTHPKAYYNIGVILANNGNYNLSKTNFDLAINLDPAYSKAYVSRGLVNYKLRNLQSASDDYHKSIELNPFNYRAYNNLAQLYVELGDIEMAIKSLKVSLSINPGYREAQANLKLLTK